MSENKTLPVVLAGRDFVLRRIPMARVKRLGATLTTIIEDLSHVDIDENKGIVDLLLDKVLEFPYEIMSLFIKDLPKEIFEDEENGVDFPEFLDTLKKAIEFNRLDALKNVFSRLTPLAIQAYQTSTLAKANSLSSGSKPTMKNRKK
jgi:hypothetical protein